MVEQQLSKIAGLYIIAMPDCCIGSPSIGQVKVKVMQLLSANADTVFKFPVRPAAFLWPCITGHG